MHRSISPSRAALLALLLLASPLSPANGVAAATPPSEAESPELLDLARHIEAEEGVGITGSLTGVVQQVNAAGADDGGRTARGSVRADVAATLPGGAVGDVQGKFFVHLRFGAGSGVTLRPTYTSTPNATGFQAAQRPSDAYATLAQAWYQLAAPLDPRGADGPAAQRIEVTAGKMDPFVFFDQNAVADDETTRFLNNAFVHNPLLDSGGDAGGDKHGFTPGVRVAYIGRRGEHDTWSVSLGAFGAGAGADFRGSLARPFVIGQLEATLGAAGDRPGTWRVYAWTNGRTPDFDDAEQRHAGWGVSIDQRVAAAVTLFVRYGHETRGDVRFDRAATLGAEVDGASWGREGDGVGVAAGWLRTSAAWREATADGVRIGYAATGSERLAELYYRWRVADALDVTPDVQWIRRPGGDAAAGHVLVAGVRARVAF